MAFTLKELRSGQTKTFTLKEVLKFLGDAVNDEILIGEERYRISSCQELGGDGNPAAILIDWVSLELVIIANGENTFFFPDTIIDTDSIFLTVNNVLYQYGQSYDYHIQDDRLYWHGPFELETTDRVILKYPSTTI